jgi:hypothetical protein
MRRERVALAVVMAEVAEDLAPRLRATAATLDIGALPEVDGTRASCAACCRTWWPTP